MTSDLVALVRNRPDVATVVDGMLAFGESLVPREVGDGVTHLYDPDGRLVVSIEAPVLVSVPGEIERLLGPEPAARVRTPTWWVEVRAAPGVSDAPRVARKFADDIVRWQGGTVFPPPTESRLPPNESGSPHGPAADDPGASGQSPHESSGAPGPPPDEPGFSYGSPAEGSGAPDRSQLEGRDSPHGSPADDAGTAGRFAPDESGRPDGAVAADSGVPGRFPPGEPGSSHVPGPRLRSDGSDVSSRPSAGGFGAPPGDGGP